ncbi:MAG: hypothetical protein V4439_01090 [Patescibacteria group bacterium]
MQKNLVLPEWVTKGTLLYEILTFEESEQTPFISPDSETQDGEEFVREMSVFEKVIYSLIEQKTKEAKKIFEDANASRFKVGSKEEKKLSKIERQAEALKNLLWESVKSEPSKTSGFGIREGFKVVYLSPEHESSSSFPFPFSGVMVEIIHL